MRGIEVNTDISLTWMFGCKKNQSYSFVFLIASFIGVDSAYALQKQDKSLELKSLQPAISDTNFYFSQNLEANNTSASAQSDRPQPVGLQTQNRQTVLTASSGEQRSTTEEQEKAILLQQVLLKIYRSNLLKKTYKHVVYPESSIKINEEGEVILIVQVDRNGKVLDVDYESKSPSSALNRAARNAVKRAKPFSKAPKALEGDNFDIQMPIRFRLTN